MVHPMESKWKSESQAKLHRLGAHGQFPPDKAEKFAAQQKRPAHCPDTIKETARADLQASPERCLREGRRLSTDPVEAARQLYTAKGSK